MKKFYNIDKMMNTEADYKGLLGGRNIGKSYQVKLKALLKKAFENNSEFIYLRRYKEDMKNQLVTNYFADMDISEITNGNYNMLYTYQGIIYFAIADENGKPTSKKQIGWAHALATAEHYKSIMFPKVTDIVFEEFIPEKGTYLPNEPSKLQSYVSTIARTRKVTVWLVGNTISKLCPYFTDWGLDRAINQKLGTIDVYKRSVTVMTENGVIEDHITIALERCKGEGLLSRMAFGDAAEMIANNEWVTESKPLITKEAVNDCNVRYTIYVFWQNLKFKCQLLYKDNNYFWYVKPASGKSKFEELLGERIISDQVSFERLTTSRLKGLTPREQKAFNIMLNKKIYYSDNTTGTDFENVLNSIK